MERFGGPRRISRIFFPALSALFLLIASAQVYAVSTWVSASAGQLYTGQTVSITWGSSGADQCFYHEGGIGIPLSGSANDTSSSPTTRSYSLTCYNTTTGAADSDSVLVTWVNPPPPPPPPSVSAWLSTSTVVYGQQAILYWSSSNATSCNTGPVSGGVYVGPYYSQGYQYFTVVCYGPGGQGSSTAVLAVIPPVPAVPGGFSISNTSPQTGQTFSISWNASSYATSYQLYQNGTYIQSTSGTSINKSIGSTGSYGYKVRACNGSGCSGFTSTITVNVSQSPPSSAPSGFSVSDTTPYHNQSITFSWNAVSGATSYQMYGDGSPYSDPVTSTSLSTTLFIQGSYNFQVAACNSGGCGPLSSGITVISSWAPPASPPSNFSISNTGPQTGQSFTVSWSPTLFTDYYEIFVNGSSNQTTSASSVIKSHSSVGSYSYKVRSCTSNGCSGFSPTITVNVIPAPPATAPSGFTVSNTNPLTTESIIFSWNAVPGATSYQMYGDGSPYSDPVPSTSLSTTILAPGSFNFQVQACNSTGCGPLTSAITITAVRPVPATPANFSISDTGPLTGETFSVSWNFTVFANYYELFVNGSLNQSTSSTSLNKSHSGAGSYGYKVRACNESGCSGFTSTINVNVVNPPSGSISAPNPGCVVPAGQSTCDSEISWTTSDVTAPCVHVQGGALWSCKGSGNQSKTWTFTNTTGHTLELRTSDSPTSQLLDSVFVQAQAQPSGSYSGPGSFDILDSDPYTVQVSASDPDGSVSSVQYYFKDQGTGVISGPFEMINSVLPTSYTYTFAAGSLPLGSHTHQVWAVVTDNDGNVYDGFAAGNTASISITVSEEPITVAPANFSVTDTDPLSNESITFSWDAVPGAANYQMYGDGLTYSDPVTNTSFPTTLLLQGSFDFQVAACNSEGCGPKSPVITVTSTWPAPANPPSNFSISNTSPLIGEEITIDWGFTVFTEFYELFVNGSLDQTVEDLSVVKSHTAGGNYDYQVRACTSNGCSPFSPAITVTVEPSNLISVEPPDETANDPEIIGQDGVGRIAGQYGVSDTGDATYTIPIITPPGINGIEPNLAFSYSSNGENGEMGFGWGVTGLSMITRCPKILAFDGANQEIFFSALNPLCLDGKRLFLLSGDQGKTGSVYDTFLREFNRVTGVGTSGQDLDGFVVEGRNGLIYEYGTTTDSRIIAVNSGVAATPPHVWLLAKVSDRSGNTMTISYENDGAPTGGFRPSEILYTSNTTAGVAAAYKLKYVWESRPVEDQPNHSAYGGEITQTKLLDRIDIQHDDGSGFITVRQYELYYELSPANINRLVKVEECDGVTLCLEPTEIFWTTNPDGDPLLVESVVDGFGNSVQFTYAEPSDTTVYTLGQGYQHPFTGEDIPAYTPQGVLVKQVTLPDGDGGSYNRTYHYTDARQDVFSNLGYLGFVERTETDSRNGIKQTWEYEFSNGGFIQSPFYGKVAYHKVEQQGGELISETTNEYDTLSQYIADYTTPFGNWVVHIHYPYLQESVQTQYEVGGPLNGALISERITTVEDIDAYGTPLEVRTEVYDRQTGSPWFNEVSTTVTVNPAAEVVNDEANWCIGIPQRTEVTSILPDSTSETRTISRVVDAAMCRVTRTVTEPDSSTLKVTTDLDYDNCGNVNSVSVTGTNPDGLPMTTRTSTANYGARCQFPEIITNALDQETELGYDYGLGVQTSITDPNNLVTGFFHDSFGRLLREDHSDGTDTVIDRQFCDAGNNFCDSGNPAIYLQVAAQQRNTSNAVVHKRVSQLSKLGQPLRTATQLANGHWSFTTTSYDMFGRVEEQGLPQSDSATGKVRYTYDLVNRVIKEELLNTGGGVDRFSSTSYAGRTVTFTDPKTNAGLHVGTVSKMFDMMGRLRNATDPAGVGGTTSYNYTYTADGRQETVTDAANNTTVIDFNRLGLRTSIDDPDMGIWTFVYNSLGELKEQTDARNQTVTYNYDDLSRTTTRTETEGTTFFNYGAVDTDHNIGRLESVTAPGGYSETYLYDNKGRPSSITYGLDSSYTVSMTYNNLGLLDTLTYPQSTGTPLTVQYGYDYGYLTQVSDVNTGGDYWTLNVMDVNGRVVSEILGNQVRQLTGYDSLRGFMQVRQGSSDGFYPDLQDLAYNWDRNGNLLNRTDYLQGGTIEDFHYDAMDRLDFTELDGVVDTDITVDGIGNITYKSGVGSYDYTSTEAGCSYYNHSQPHAVRNAGGISYCYDANGNMTRRGSDTISWTSYNKPSVINGNGFDSTFSYGAFRNRWRQVATYPTGTETTIYVGGLMEKVDRNGLTEYRHRIATGSDATVIHTRRSDGSSDTYYTTSDHLGSGDVVTDQSGAQIVRLSFTAFGERRSGDDWYSTPTAGDMAAIADVTRRGYTQHEMLDNVGLIHMNGRVYDQVLGRFISADPVVQAPGYSQSLNRYSYVWNNPLNATDPSGFKGLRGTSPIDGYVCDMNQTTAFGFVDNTNSGEYRNGLVPSHYWNGNYPNSVAPCSGGVGTYADNSLIAIDAWINSQTQKAFEQALETSGENHGTNGTFYNDSELPSYYTGGLGSLLYGIAQGAFKSTFDTLYLGVCTNCISTYVMLQSMGIDASPLQYDPAATNQQQLGRDIGPAVPITGIAGSLRTLLTRSTNKLHLIAEQIRKAGHRIAASRRTIAVGEDSLGNLYVGSSNGLDAGMREAAERLSVNIVPSVKGLHAEEELLRSVDDLIAVGTSKRLPCGPNEHNCAAQLIDAGVKITNP